MAVPIDQIRYLPREARVPIHAWVQRERMDPPIYSFTEYQRQQKARNTQARLKTTKDGKQQVGAQNFIGY